MQSKTLRLGLFLVLASTFAFTTNCDMIKSARKAAGLKDKKTEKFLKVAGGLVYALLDATPDANKFMKDNARKKAADFKKADQKKIKKISDGLKRLDEITDPAQAKKEAEDVYKEANKLTSNAKAAMYAAEIKKVVDDYSRLFDEWKKVAQNVTNGGDTVKKWNEFLKAAGYEAKTKGKKKKGKKKGKKKKK